MSQRRPKRKCQIRNLLDKITRIEEEEQSNLSASSTVADVLKNLNQININEADSNNVKHVDETHMHVKIYNCATNISYKCTSKVEYDRNTFDPNEFASAIDDLIEDSDEYEKNLSLLLQNYRTAIPLHREFAPLYGSLDEARVELPVRKPRQRREPQNNNEPKKKLIAIEEASKENNPSSNDVPKNMLKVLTSYFKQTNAPVDYYSFLIDTSDFGRTVENMFYMSFLVNDGKVKMSLDASDGRLKLEPVEKSLLQKTGSAEKTQMVMSITMDLWKSFKFKEGILQTQRSQHAF